MAVAAAGAVVAECGVAVAVVVVREVAVGVATTAEVVEVIAAVLAAHLRCRDQPDVHHRQLAPAAAIMQAARQALDRRMGICRLQGLDRAQVPAADPGRAMLPAGRVAHGRVLVLALLLAAYQVQEMYQRLAADPLVATCRTFSICRPVATPVRAGHRRVPSAQPLDWRVARWPQVRPPNS